MFAIVTGLMAVLMQVFGLFTATGLTVPATPVGSGPATEAVCPAATTMQATCLSWVRALSGHRFQAAATSKALPAGYGPTQFRTAYGYSTSGSASIAVVTAYDNPRITSDLATYDKTYGLPNFPTCTTAK